MRDSDTYRLLSDEAFLEEQGMCGTQLLDLVRRIEDRCKVDLGEVRSIEDLTGKQNAIVRGRGRED